MNRLSLRTNIRANLADNGITYYSDEAINTSIQDGYNEVAAKCRCIITSAQVAQQALTPYYDFNALGVPNYLGTFAIFNQDTNFWLRDDISLRDYDRLRRDWEQWTGEPQFWTPHSPQYVAIAPNLAAVTGANFFTLWYWATAPAITSDTQSILIPTDMQQMLEQYGTGDLLQNAEEVTKAEAYLGYFEKEKVKLKKRMVDLARHDLLLRV